MLSGQSPRFAVFAAFALLAGCRVMVAPAVAANPPPPEPEPVVVEAEAAPAPAQPADTYDDQDPVALTDFKPALDPSGVWVDDPTYGTVWVPSTAVVGADFVPYSTAGHWVHDDDWVWVSDYSWGWAPFHYGRWVLIDGRGWAWIPGREYRGAWVSWGADDGYAYLGWAPMAPEYVWVGGEPRAYRYEGSPRWAYVPRGEVFSVNVSARVVRGPEAEALSGRVHVYAAAEGGHRGPPPEKFGYSAQQIPHGSAADRASIERAHTFARPSTAIAAGAGKPRGAKIAAQHSVAGHAQGQGGDASRGHPPAAANGHGRGGAPAGRPPGPAPHAAPRPSGPAHASNNNKKR